MNTPGGKLLTFVLAFLTSYNSDNFLKSSVAIEMYSALLYAGLVL